MKKLFLILTVLSIAWNGNAQTRQEKEVLQLSKAKFKWLVSKNVDSLKYFLDDRLTYVHSNGWMQSKTELINDLLSGKLTYVSIEVMEDSIRVYSRSAVVTGKGKFVAIIDGSTNTYILSYTETYVLQKGNPYPVILHFFASRLPDAIVQTEQNLHFFVFFENYLWGNILLEI